MIFYIQSKRQQEMIAGALSQYNQIPHPLGEQHPKWKISIAERFSHGSETSEPHIRLPSLGVWHQEEDPPEHLAIKANRAYVQELYRAGENRISDSEGVYKVSHALGPREKP